MSLPHKAVIGMVHVRALPGAPGAGLAIGEIARVAAEEARVLAGCGFDVLIVENMHDRPYIHGRHGPETVAAMTRVGLEVRAAAGVPLGVQVLSGGNAEALAVALAIGAFFIRAENFVFAHVADEGLLERAEAGPLLRYRRAIAAEDVKVFADVKKKHASHALTADVSVADAAAAAEFFGADGVIVSGSATGRAASIEDVAAAAGAVGVPVLVGSGVTPRDLGAIFEHADGVIVGSWCKEGGVWSNPLDAGRCRELVAEARRVRGG